MNQSPLVHGLSVGLAAATLCLVAETQTPSPLLESASAPQVDLRAALEEWRVDFGQAWRARPNYETGHANFIYGFNAAPRTKPVTDAEYYRTARDFMIEANGLMGIEDTTLVEDQVLVLPMGLYGSTDKVTVRFRQAVNGVPVERGFVNSLFELQSGKLLSLDTTGLPNVAGLDTTPTVDAETAVGFAIQQFRQETGITDVTFTNPELVIAQEKVGKFRQGTLTWKTRVLSDAPGQVEGFVYYVAAQGSARVAQKEAGVHFFDVGGTVTSLATPGTLPDTASNPEQAFPMAYMTVTSSAGTTTTDANGNFNFPGATGPLAVTFAYNGLYNNTNDSSGAEYVLTQNLTGTGNNVLMNAAANQDDTAEANVFLNINRQRDWTRAQNAADGMMDFVNTSNVMINDTCNAFYNGNSTNYYPLAGGCNNTAFSTVISHEQGHWQNDRYGSGNGFDGFGEGNADVFAMYLHDDPIVGNGFTTGGGIIRSGNNTRQYCGDGNNGCHGGVHANGEVHMGAMWKMRANLNSTHGNAQGDMIADILFSGFMNAYDQGLIDSIIETQLLTLDDDDGQIENGSPNYSDIDAAFRTQGFPGFDLSFIVASNFIHVSDTPDEAGPYGVAADLSPLFSPTVAVATLEYRVNGAGGFIPVAMTNLQGNTWTGLIPGVPSPARIDYRITAFDGSANSQTFPDGGLFDFSIGETQLFFTDGFETVGDNGWTHQQVATQDDWQHDAPNPSGSPNDPGVAANGTRIWGNDLAPSGFNGDYQPNVNNFLLSPPIDLSGAVGSKLSFNRWLTVEEGIFDRATISVNGTQVFANPLNGHLLDNAWTPVEIDISSVADGIANTQVEFRLVSDGGLEFGGWNIDDFEILTSDPTPTACQPTNYGAGTAGVAGVPLLDSGGVQSQLGTMFQAKIKNGPPNGTAILGVGNTQISIPFLGGTLLTLPNLIRTTVPLDIFGQGTVPISLIGTGLSPGATFFMQGIVFDGAAPSGVSFTRGMQVVLCN